MQDLHKALLDVAQRDFPLTPRPFAELALRLGVREDDVIEAFRQLQDERVVGRIGAVYRTGAVGASCLAALAAPAERLDEVAALVSAWPEVNHNYEREHRLNLWFVIAAPDEARMRAVLTGIKADTGLDVLCFPMVEAFHLDLGFKLHWN